MSPADRSSEIQSKRINCDGITNLFGSFFFSLASQSRLLSVISLTLALFHTNIVAICRNMRCSESICISIRNGAVDVGTLKKATTPNRSKFHSFIASLRHISSADDIFLLTQETHGGEKIGSLTRSENGNWVYATTQRNDDKAQRRCISYRDRMTEHRDDATVQGDDGRAQSRRHSSQRR